METFTISLGSIYRVRLRSAADAGIETNVSINRGVGGRISVIFDAKTSEKVTLSTVELSGGEESQNNESDAEEAAPVCPSWTRSIPMEWSPDYETCAQMRNGIATLVVRNLMALVDAAVEVRAGAGAYNPRDTKSVDVSIGETLIGSCWADELATNGGYRGRLMTIEVMQRLKVKSSEKSAAVVPTREKLSTFAPLGATVLSAPRADYAGEAPLPSLTMRIEPQPSLLARDKCETFAEEAATAKRVLGRGRVQGKYEGLDKIIADRHIREKLNVVLVLGATGGLVAKSMPLSSAKGIRFHGVLPHGSPDRLGNLVLEKGTQMSNVTSIIEQFATFVSKPIEQIRLLLVIVEGCTELIFNEGKQMKQLTSAKERVGVANAWIPVLPSETEVMVLLDEVGAVGTFTDWVGQAYIPPTFSLAHTYIYVGRMRNYTRTPSVVEFSATTEKKCAEFLIALLRDNPEGEYRGVDSCSYPLWREDNGMGSARLETFTVVDPNTNCQTLLLPVDLGTIHARWTQLVAYCKPSDQKYGFAAQKGANIVPIEFFNSTWINKAIWQLTGHQAPTQKAQRMAPLSVLFPLLDFDVFINVILLLSVLYETCAGMHTYEAAQKISGLGLLTKHEALRRLRLEQDAAIRGAKGERGPVTRFSSEKDARDYAAPLLPLCDAHVTEKTKRLIEHFADVGKDKKPGKPSSQQPQNQPPQGPTNPWAGFYEAKTATSSSAGGEGTSRGRGAGRATGRGGRQRGRGRGGNPPPAESGA